MSNEALFDPAAEQWPDCSHPEPSIRPGLLRRALMGDAPMRALEDADDETLTLAVGPKLCSHCAAAWTMAQQEKGHLNPHLVFRAVCIIQTVAPKLLIQELRTSVHLAAHMVGAKRGRPFADTGANGHVAQIDYERAARITAESAETPQPPRFIIWQEDEVHLDIDSTELLDLLEFLEVMADQLDTTEPGAELRRRLDHLKRDPPMTGIVEGRATARACPDGHPHVMPTPDGVQAFTRGTDIVTIELTCSRCGHSIDVINTKSPVPVHATLERVQ